MSESYCVRIVLYQNHIMSELYCVRNILCQNCIVSESHCFTIIMCRSFISLVPRDVWVGLVQNSLEGIFDPDPNLRTPLQLNYSQAAVTHADGTVHDPATMIDVNAQITWVRDCLSLEAGTDFALTDSSCSQENAVICQWKGEIVELL